MRGCSGEIVKRFAIWTLNKKHVSRVNDGLFFLGLFSTISVEALRG